MKKIFTLVALLLFCSFSFLSAQQTNTIPGDIIVMLHSNEQAADFVASLQTVDGIKSNFKQVRLLSRSMHIMLFNFDAATLNQDRMLQAVKLNPLTVLAQFNFTAKDRLAPNDINYTNGNMWDMNNTGQNGGTADADIDAPEAWDITTGGLTAQGDTIVVAVVDGGFDLTHEDLNFWVNRHEIAGNGIDDDNNGYIDDVKGWNAATGTDNITSASHGTHVSGTVGARGNNSIGVTGVNWHVRIMPIMYGNVNAANDADVLVAYSYAMDNRSLYNQTNGLKGAFVVATNSSFGIDLAQPSAHPIWCAVYDSLGSVGILSATATANANYNVDVQGDIPTACASDWMIAVTNTTNTDAKNNMCGYGATTIDIGAPGTGIWSTLPGNAYGGSSWSGTSMATPHVAGAVALMYSVQCAGFIANCKSNPAAMALVVKDSLLNAADPNADLNGITVSGGRLNLFKSVKSIQNYCTYVGITETGESTASLEIKNVFPNPAKTILNIAYYSSEPAAVVLSDVLGRELIRLNERAAAKGIQNTILDIGSVARGVYSLSIWCGGQKSNTVKVIIQ